MAEPISEISDDAVEDELYKSLRQQLRLMSLGSKRHSEHKKNVLRIKLEYRGEKRSIEIERNADHTVSMEVLEAHLHKMYGMSLNMYYTQGNNEVIVAIRGQAELDRAVQLVDKNGQRYLRMVLSKHQSTSVSSSLQPDKTGTFTQKVVEVAVSESCSSCGATSSVKTIPRSGGSSCSSGVQDDWRNSGRTPTVPTHWKQGKCLGRGSFGAVYIAYDVDLSREVVVKRVDVTRSESSARKDIFGLENDVNVLGSLRHDRIVQYLGVSKNEDCLLIFMEYMACGTVKDLITQYERLSENAAEKYTRQVLEGLAFLHRKDIVHRDIKSANILRDHYGNVKIGDFGSGKRLQALATHQGSTTGTPHYMAPEVVLGRTRFGRKADIWSVGVTLVEMLCGKVPYKDLEAFEAMLKIAYEEPKTDLPEGITDEMVGLVKKLMTKEPENRPHAVEVLESYTWTVPD